YRHQSVLAGYRQQVPVGAVRQMFSISTEDTHFLSRVRVEELHHAVWTRRSQERTHGAEQHPGGAVGAALKNGYLLAGRLFPQLPNLVRADRGRPPAVRSEGNF